VRALVVDAGRVAFCGDRAAPRREAGEARVRVRCAGVCSTDLALVRGYMGFSGIPGHEFVGEALDGPHRGRRVVGEINAACGACDTCRAGRPRHCPERTVLGLLGRGGAFAEELCLPAGNLHPVPDSVPDERAVFVEPLAAAFEIAEQVELRAGLRALVAGDGRLGILCAQVLRLAGLEVTLAGRHPERARWLPAGIAHRTDLLEGQSPAGEAPWELAVEATGDPAVLPRLLARMRPGGTVVLKTTSERSAPLDLAPAVVNELTLVGSRCGPFEPALAALATGQVVVEPMVQARYSLENGAAALAHAARPGVLKVLIDVEEIS